MHTKPLDQQTALVTGGGSGIGRAFARELLSMGYGHVIIASRRESVLATTVNELSNAFPNQRIGYFVFDIREQDQTKALVAHASKQTGAVDLLINNSGLAVPEVVESITDAAWDTVFETNLRGAMW